MYTFDERIVSDFYKEVYGSRSAASMWPSDGTDDEKQAAWDELVESFKNQQEEENLHKQECESKFEEVVRQSIEYGAKDRKTALRWLLGGDRFDFEQAIWDRGLFHKSEEYWRELNGNDTRDF